MKDLKEYAEIIGYCLLFGAFLILFFAFAAPLIYVSDLIRKLIGGKR